jgi:hypothetical protein
LQIFKISDCRSKAALPQSEIGVNLQLQGSTEVLKAIQTFLITSRLAAEPDCAIVPEGRPRNNCNVCFAQ